MLVNYHYGKLVLEFGKEVKTLDNNQTKRVNSGNLKVVRLPWSGWDKEKSESKMINIKPESGKEIVLKGVGEKEYTLKLVDVKQEEINLVVDGLSLKQGEDISKEGIDLGGCGAQDFIINKGETVELNTCSTDVGVKWQITFEK